MREDQAGLLVHEIFQMAQALSRDQRLSLALALVHDSDRPVLDAMIPVRAALISGGTEPGESSLTTCGHSKYDPCHNCGE